MGKVYVDVDLYGRGFDQIFGKEAEEAYLSEAFATIASIHIDRDRYGRGDPAVFQKKALKKALKEISVGSSQHEKGCFKFAAAIKAAARKTSAVVTRVKSLIIWNILLYSNTRRQRRNTKDHFA